MSHRLPEFTQSPGFQVSESVSGTDHLIALFPLKSIQKSLMSLGRQPHMKEALGPPKQGFHQAEAGDKRLDPESRPTCPGTRAPGPGGLCCPQAGRPPLNQD